VRGSLGGEDPRHDRRVTLGQGDADAERFVRDDAYHQAGQAVAFYLRGGRVDGVSLGAVTLDQQPWAVLLERLRPGEDLSLPAQGRWLRTAVQSCDQPRPRRRGLGGRISSSNVTRACAGSTITACRCAPPSDQRQRPDGVDVAQSLSTKWLPVPCRS